MSQRVFLDSQSLIKKRSNGEAQRRHCYQKQFNDQMQGSWMLKGHEEHDLIIDHDVEYE
jgi:hypothetical protein